MLPATKPVRRRLDALPCRWRPKPVTLDGNLAEWPAALFHGSDAAHGHDGRMGLVGTRRRALSVSRCSIGRAGFFVAFETFDDPRGHRDGSHGEAGHPFT